jgi:hypothetical protein
MNDPMSPMSSIRTINPMNPMSTFSPMDPSGVRSTMDISNPMGTSSREAYGLASLGRGQDSMLVHMSPDEVSSLQNLARANGGSLTTNPDTGLPEAEVLSSILPALADQASNPFIAGSIAGLKAMNSGIASFGVGGSVEKSYFPEYTSTSSSYDPSRSSERAYSFSRGDVPISATLPIPAADLPRPGTFNAKTLPLGRPDIAAANYNVTYENAPAKFEKLWAHRTEKEGGSKQIYEKMVDWASPEKIIARGGNPNDTQWKLMREALATGKVDPRLKPKVLLTGMGTGLSETARHQQHKPKNFFTQYLMDPLIEAGLSAIPGIGPGLAMAYGGIKGGVEGGPLGALTGIASAYGASSFGSGLGSAVSSTGGIGSVLTHPGAFLHNLGTEFLPGTITSGANIPAGTIPAAWAPKTGIFGGLGDAAAKYRQYANLLVGPQKPPEKKVPGHAEGGYLSGRGDGMSDDIRATIDGKQPARLSAGEFVIPADVVGHLGNGSSEAGAKKLYAMMDKVRNARTGTPAQGREIDADRYLPA